MTVATVADVETTRTQTEARRSSSSTLDAELGVVNSTHFIYPSNQLVVAAARVAIPRIGVGALMRPHAVDVAQ
jgi:hypothetical protein